MNLTEEFELMRDQFGLFHFVYNSTCPKTGRYYIGVHSTNNLDDGYTGSGDFPINYVRKYGKGVLIREIIDFFPTRKQAENREESIIGLVLGIDPLCKNIVPGGRGCDSARSREINKMKTPKCLAAAAAKSGDKTRGRRKETHAGVAKMAQALKGRRKETHSGIKMQAEKITGRTKETHPGVKSQSEKMTGRTARTHAGIAQASMKKIKIKDEWVIWQICDLYQQGFNRGEIRRALDLQVSPDTIDNILKRAGLK